MLSPLADIATSPPVHEKTTGYSMMMKEGKKSFDDALEDGDGLYYHQRLIAVLAAGEAWGGV
jgi:hypothetical protein